MQICMAIKFRAMDRANKIVTELEQGNASQKGREMQEIKDYPFEFCSLSWRTATSVLLSEYVCLAIMALSWGWSAQNWVAGALLAFGLGLLTCYTIYVRRQFSMKHLQIRDVYDIAAHLLARFLHHAYRATAIMLLLNNLFLIGLHLFKGVNNFNVVNDLALCTVTFQAISAILGVAFSLPRTLSLGFGMCRLSCALLGASLIVVIIAAASDMSPSRPVFDPATLNAIRSRAVADTNAILDALGDAALEAAAGAFFVNRDGDAASRPAEVEHLKKSYRAEQLLIAVHQALKTAYPHNIAEQPTWLWNNVGGVFGRMAILSCSLSEYLILFGTSTPQSGFSGYYTSLEVHDLLIMGTMQSFGATPAAANPLLYTPDGRQSHLEPRVTRYYATPTHTCSNTDVVVSLPRCYRASSRLIFFTNHDWASLGDQLGACAEQILGGFLHPKGNISREAGKERLHDQSNMMDGVGD